MLVPRAAEAQGLPCCEARPPVPRTHCGRPPGSWPCLGGEPCAQLGPQHPSGRRPGSQGCSTAASQSPPARGERSDTNPGPQHLRGERGGCPPGTAPPPKAGPRGQPLAPSGRPPAAAGDDWLWRAPREGREGRPAPPFAPLSPAAGRRRARLRRAQTARRKGVGGNGTGRNTLWGGLRDPGRPRALGSALRSPARRREAAASSLCRGAGSAEKALEERPAVSCGLLYQAPSRQDRLY